MVKIYGIHVSLVHHWSHIKPNEESKGRISTKTETWINQHCCLLCKPYVQSKSWKIVRGKPFRTREGTKPITPSEFANYKCT